ncbi:hypothetical protein [Caballeronia arationis]|uniref:hypothetical protein n=1 Tax=Caballeronia arationis TaxID=1777142 RepID=UPI0011981FB1|nr:hypothetical protein [Caballeronia arationis]
MTIGEVQLETPEPDSREPRNDDGGGARSAASMRAPRPDPEALRLFLRRDEERGMRLRVD